MKTPTIDLKGLKKLKEENFQERLLFLKKYAQWIKTTSNEKWSKEQRDIIE